MSPVGRQQKILNPGPKSNTTARLVKPDTSPPPEPQNSQTHKIFIFGSDHDSVRQADNGSIELTEIRSRKENWGVEKVDDLQKSHYFDHEVVEDDSLAKLSLKFGCTITQLKQANGIYNDQDLFAFKTLKIPVYKHSLLWETVGHHKHHKTEQLAKAKRSYSDPNLKHLQNGFNTDIGEFDNFNGISADYTYSDDEDDYWESERRHLMQERPKSSQHLNETNNAYEEYLENVDKDIQKLSDQVQSKCDDRTSMLGHSLAYMQPSSNDKNTEQKLGQVGWVSYKGVLVALCVVTVLVPLMYILYFKVYNKTK
eukprot:gene10047-11077_t